MKIVDDYNAKIRLWVKHVRVARSYPPPRLPAFRSKKFRNHEEMNAWKRELLRQLARSSPPHG